MENPDQARDLSRLLHDRKIEHQLEIKTNTNWGDEHYGHQTFVLWVIDEDAFDQACELRDQFLENPFSEDLKPKSKPLVNLFKPKKENGDKIIPPTPVSSSLITFPLILLCTFLYFFSGEAPTKSPLLVPSPASQWLLFDYPKAAELYTKVIKIWTSPENEALPPEGEILLAQAEKTPYWRGIYDDLVARYRGQPPVNQGPLFEKIQEGQIWRFFTPALLHGNFLHILFNMLWLWMLGKDIERILPGYKYVVLMGALAFFSNTSQYLMSGFSFLGFSGVITGLAFFIRERQRKAPWEGYTLQTPIYFFLLIYIFGLAAIQAISFFFEVGGFSGLPMPIGNTAHVSGAILGYFLGRLNWFKWCG